MQPKTIKSKDNGCGTAPGNLVTTECAVECNYFLQTKSPFYNFYIVTIQDKQLKTLSI